MGENFGRKLGEGVIVGRPVRRPLVDEIDDELLADVVGNFALINGVLPLELGVVATFGESATGTRGERGTADRCLPRTAILGEIAIGAGLMNLFFRFTSLLAMLVVAITAFRKCCSVSAVSSISTSLFFGKFMRLAGVTADDPAADKAEDTNEDFLGGGILISLTPSITSEDFREVEMTGDE